jgi:hypothetical protein
VAGSFERNNEAVCLLKSREFCWMTKQYLASQEGI